MLTLAWIKPWSVYFKFAVKFTDSLSYNILSTWFTGWRLQYHSTPLAWISGSYVLTCFHGRAVVSQRNRCADGNELLSTLVSYPSLWIHIIRCVVVRISYIHLAVLQNSRSERNYTMMVQLLLLLLFVTFSRAARPRNNDDSVFVNHHNSGYSLRQTMKVATFTNYGRMLFHFSIPQSHTRIPIQRIECTQTNTTNRELNNWRR